MPADANDGPQLDQIQPIILASRSVARGALLERIGVPYRSVPSGIDESALSSDDPIDLARRLATAKLRAVAAGYPNDAVIVAADTVVWMEDDTTVHGAPPNTVDARSRGIVRFATPEALESARAMLSSLSGREHLVATALAVRDEVSGFRVKSTTTAVRFRTLDATEIDWYLTTGEWRGAAGGYRIQGRGELFVDQIRGSFSNVVGLPLGLFYEMLAGGSFRTNIFAR